jgi:histidinol phosphatase-like enzyme
MIVRAVRELGLDLARSYLIGDGAVDLELAATTRTAPCWCGRGTVARRRRPATRGCRSPTSPRTFVRRPSGL